MLSDYKYSQGGGDSNNNSVEFISHVNTDDNIHPERDFNNENYRSFSGIISEHITDGQSCHLTHTNYQVQMVLFRRGYRWWLIMLLQFF